MPWEDVNNPGVLLSDEDVGFAPVAETPPADEPDLSQAQKNYNLALARQQQMQTSGAWDQLPRSQQKFLEPTPPDETSLGAAGRAAKFAGQMVLESPRLIGQFVGGLGKTVEAGIGKAAGTGDTLEDVARTTLGINRGDRIERDTQMPVEKAASKIKGLPGVAARVGLGLAGTAPQMLLAAAAAPEALTGEALDAAVTAGTKLLWGAPLKSWLASSAATGGIFGLESNGDFSLKQAAIGGLLHFVTGGTSEAVSRYMAGKIAAGSIAATKPVVNKLTHLAAQQIALDAYMAAADAPELVAEFRQEPERAKQHLQEIVGQNLAFAALGVKDFRGKVPSQTEKFITDNAEKYSEAAFKLLGDKLTMPDLAERKAAMQQEYDEATAPTGRSPTFSGDLGGGAPPAPSVTPADWNPPRPSGRILLKPPVSRPRVTLKGTQYERKVAEAGPLPLVQSQPTIEPAAGQVEAGVAQRGGADEEVAPAPGEPQAVTPAVESIGTEFFSRRSKEQDESLVNSHNETAKEREASDQTPAGFYRQQPLSPDLVSQMDDADLLSHFRETLKTIKEVGPKGASTAEESAKDAVYRLDAQTLYAEARKRGVVPEAQALEKYSGPKQISPEPAQPPVAVKPSLSGEEGASAAMADAPSTSPPVAETVAGKVWPTAPEPTTYAGYRKTETELTKAHSSNLAELKNGPHEKLIEYLNKLGVADNSQTEINVIRGIPGTPSWNDIMYDLQPKFMPKKSEAVIRDEKAYRLVWAKKELESWKKSTSPGAAQPIAGLEKEIASLEDYLGVKNEPIADAPSDSKPVEPVAEKEPELGPLIDQPKEKKGLPAERNQIVRLLETLEEEDPRTGMPSPKEGQEERVKKLRDRLAVVERQMAGSRDAVAAVESGGTELAGEPTSQLSPQAEAAVAASTPPNAPTPTPTLETHAKQRAGFNAKQAKEQKKFLLSEIDKAEGEAPNIPIETKTKAWEASPEFQDWKAATEWHNKNPGPFRYEFRGDNSESAFDAAVEAHLAKGHAELKELADRWKANPKADAALQIAKESHAAYYARQPHVTIDIPGDGTFSILNDKAAIQDFREKAKDFPTTAPKSSKPSTPRATETKPASVGKLNSDSAFKAASLAVATGELPESQRFPITHVWSDGQNTVGVDGRRLIRIQHGSGGTVKNPLLKTPEGSVLKETKEVKFPKWRQVVPDPKSLAVVGKDLDAARLFTALKQAQQVLTERSNSIKLFRNPDGSIGVVSSAPEVGEYSHNIQEGAKAIAALDPEFLIDALNAARMVGDEKVSLESGFHQEGPEGGTGLSPLVVRSAHTESVIMPMRMGEGGPEGGLTRGDLAAGKTKGKQKPIHSGIEPENHNEEQKQAQGASDTTPVMAGTLLPDRQRVASDLAGSGEVLRLSEPEVEAFYPDADRADRPASESDQAGPAASEDLRRNLHPGGSPRNQGAFDRARILFITGTEGAPLHDGRQADLLAHRILFGADAPTASFVLGLSKKLPGLKFVFVARGDEERGFYYPERDSVVINTNKLAEADFSNPQHVAFWDAILSEELIHAVTVRVSSKSEIEAVWHSLTDGERAVVKETYDPKGERGPLSDYQLGNEYLRMVVQERLTGEISEHHSKPWRITDEVRARLKQIVDFIRAAFGQKPANDIARQVIDRIEAAIRGEEPIRQSVFESGSGPIRSGIELGEEEKGQEDETRFHQVAGVEQGSEYTPQNIATLRRLSEENLPIASDEDAWALAHQMTDPLKKAENAQMVETFGGGKGAPTILAVRLWDHATKMTERGDDSLQRFIVEHDQDFAQLGEAGGGTYDMGLGLRLLRERVTPRWRAIQLLTQERLGALYQLLKGKNLADELIRTMQNLPVGIDELEAKIREGKDAGGKTIEDIHEASSLSEAERILDAYERSQTEWLKPEAKLSEIRQIIKEALTQGPRHNYVEEKAWREKLSRRFQDVVNDEGKALVPPDIADRLAFEVWKDKTARESAATAKAWHQEGRREASNAEQLLNQWAKEQTEWVKPETRNRVKEIIRDFFKRGLDKDRPEAFRESLTRALMDVGAPENTARELAFQAWNKKRSLDSAAVIKAQAPPDVNQEATRIMHSLEKASGRGAEWLQPETKAVVAKIIREFIKPENATLPALTTTFIRDLRKRLTDAGVQKGVADRIAQAVFENENAKHTTQGSKKMERAAQSTNLRSLIEAIMATPYRAQNDPAWRQRTAQEWFESNGLSADHARAAAGLFNAQFEQAFQAAAERAASRLLSGGKLDPKTVKDVLAAIRLGLTDPSKNWQDAIAQRAGFRPLSAEAQAQIAKLDEALQNPALSPQEFSNLHEQMRVILSHAGTHEKGFRRALAEGFVNSLLSGIRTLTLHEFIPMMMAARDLPQMALNDPANTFTFAKAIYTAYRNVLVAETKYAWQHDAYGFALANMDKDFNVLKRVFQDAQLQYQAGAPLAKAGARLKQLYAVQHYVGKVLNTAVQSTMASTREWKLVYYASLAFKEAGLSTRNISDLVEAMALQRQERYAAALEAGLDETTAKVRANHEVGEVVQDFVSNRTGNDTLGFKVLRAAEHDVYSMQGRKAKGIDELDEGFLSRPFLEFIKLMSRLRKQGGPETMLTTSMFGFVAIPFRVMRYASQFGPYGLLRSGINHYRINVQQKETFWKQSFANSLQAKARFNEALAGTIVTLLAAGWAAKHSTADDDAGKDEFGLYITGAGPSNKVLKEAFDRAGWKRHSLNFVIHGHKVEIPLTRAGVMLMAPFMIPAGLDDAAWKKKELAAAGRGEKFGVSTMVGAQIGAHFAMAGQQGILQNVEAFARAVQGGEGTVKAAAKIGTSVASASLLPFKQMLASLSDMFVGPLDQSSMSAALAAAFPLVGLPFQQKGVNRFGDQLYDQSWYGKMVRTGIPIAFQVSKTPENESLYNGLLLQKAAAPPALMRSAIEERYGPLTDEQWSRFARVSGASLKASVLGDLVDLKSATPEEVKRAMTKAATAANAEAADALGLERVKETARGSGGGGAGGVAAAGRVDGLPSVVAGGGGGARSGASLGGGPATSPQGAGRRISLGGRRKGLRAGARRVSLKRGGRASHVRARLGLAGGRKSVRRVTLHRSYLKA